MPEEIPENNNKWYCEYCDKNHDCLNCDTMEYLFEKRYYWLSLEVNDNLLEKNKKIVDLLDLEKKNRVVFCWDCQNIMRKSKFKKGPAYWCPSCRSK